VGRAVRGGSRLMGAVAKEPGVEVRVLVHRWRRRNSGLFSSYRGGRGGGRTSGGRLVI
jgi:hypothetical protein